MTFSTLIKTAFKGIILALIFSGGVAKYGKAEVNLNSLGSGLRDIVSAFRKNDS